MTMRYPAACLLAFAVTGGVAWASAPRALSFDERVTAQEAIERVSYSHQIGTTKSFEAAVPRAVLVSKVRSYLERSAALQEHWKTPVSDTMLQRELVRMAAGSKMPQRLLELYAALGNDPFVIKECLARAILVDRLTRSFEAASTSPPVPARPLSSYEVEAVATGDDRLPMPAAGLAADGIPCAADDTWDNGILDAVPDQRINPTTLWTGSVMIVWGGFRGPNIWLGTGGRYDPATDSWAPITTTGAASRRVDHVSVWTGSEMIVWSGWDGVSPSALTTGGRYNPVTDTWTPTATSGTPTGRQYGTAVWTGTEMIVWGGGNGLNTGGRYNPASDTWASTSLVGAPSPRLDHTAVWTGSRMVIWGGSEINVQSLNTGGLYDPVTNTWMPTSLVGAPARRAFHTAVWTGSRMVVWGAATSSNTGGRYDPATDSWTPTSTAGAPPGRSEHTAVWTGTEMLVWGGTGASSDYLNSGGRYNPVTDSWTLMATSGAPVGRIYHGAVWTGSRMIVWGGTVVGVTGLDTGGRYDPATDKWTPTAVDPAPSIRVGHTAVWTGSEMIVWGGTNAGVSFGDGGRYDPATDNWTPTATLGAPSPRNRHSAGWTGSQMIVWGGGNAGGLLGTGGRYDPASDSWTPTSIAGAPAARATHVAVWTGNRMIVWGGLSTTGGRYDPVSDSWTPTATAGAPPAPLGTAVWTGSRMIVWGSDADAVYLNIGGRYDPVGDSWQPTSTLGAPAIRTHHSAVWTGNRMVVWGGVGQDEQTGEYDLLNTGGRYDPVADTWTATTTTGAPSARAYASAVNLSGPVLVWGGETGAGATRSGGRYNPATDQWAPVSTFEAPPASSRHTAVWTGSLMIVWGGTASAGSVKTGGRYVFGASTDHDGDTFTACQGDCNDLNPAINPNAIEICNNFDDNCDGKIDEDASGIDTDGDALRNACDDCPLAFNPAQSDFDHDGVGDVCDTDDGVIFVDAGDATYRSWQAEAGFTSWNSYRGSLAVLRSSGEYTQAPGSNPLAARDCGLAATTVFDPIVPGPGEVAFQLVTGVAGGIESGLGTASSGAPRVNAHPCP